MLLDLPHAGTIALRIAHRFERQGIEEPTVEALVELLLPYRSVGENLPTDEAQQVQAQAASWGRSLVIVIEKLELGEDKLGQCIRNLFECLDLAEEGSTLSLRAGENPYSLQRPHPRT
jgi:hypothetical protein